MSYVEITHEVEPSIIMTRWGRFSDLATEHIRGRVLHYLRYYGIQAIRRYFPKGGTGRLEDGLRIVDYSTPHKIQFAIEHEDPEMVGLIRILEYGSPPHPITPRYAQVLAFYPEVVVARLGPGGILPIREYLPMVFREYVNHPGNRAYRMFEQGMNDIRMELIDVIQRALKEVQLDILRVR